MVTRLLLAGITRILPGVRVLAVLTFFFIASAQDSYLDELDREASQLDQNSAPAVPATVPQNQGTNTLPKPNVDDEQTQISGQSQAIEAFEQDLLQTSTVCG